MASYAELNARPASDFLDPEKFRTDWDRNLAKREERYRKELKRCKDYRVFHVGVNGTWIAACKDGSVFTSYESIGYHAYTADLLRAVLESDCRVIVHRWDGDKIVDYILQVENHESPVA